MSIKTNRTNHRRNRNNSLIEIIQYKQRISCAAINVRSNLTLIRECPWCYNNAGIHFANNAYSNIYSNKIKKNAHYVKLNLIRKV